MCGKLTVVKIGSKVNETKIARGRKQTLDFRHD